ncbi:MAG: hypothetical protein KKF52_02105 [Nanoarchaeota archaeon]|nr:hypothetical protein [Nanoarchaeota archaeon]MBU4242003.1 hypothetical protein [Nanoarchaeota archaeon]MBU4352570.1 hypothetical protein [Nanoarchaeota archaeon]MCG2719966.1 hypothetical protein [Nanoarchaeota archaeon]
MAIENQILIVMYILLGAVAAMLYSLRRILLLESKILSLEKAILEFDKKLVKHSSLKKNKK